MKKERVLIVHNYYQIPGGEDTVVENEKEMLEDNGHEVFMYTRHNNEIKEKGIIGKLLLPFETIYSFKTVRDIKKIVKNKKIDIVHVHNTFPLISPSIYKVSKKCGVKLVQTIHNYRLICAGAMLYRNEHICIKCIENNKKYAMKYKCYRNSYIQTGLVLVSNYINKKIKSFENVDKYICLSEFSKSKISSFIEPSKIVIKSNFEDYNKKINYNNSKRDYFLYIGRLDKTKGIDILIKSWKNIEREKLIVIGTGDLENEIKDYISKFKLDNIELKGRLHKDDAMKYICEAKSLIFPSQCYETFGLVIIEALKRGTPVIVNDIGNISELIENDRCGYLSIINDENSMCKAINNFNELYEADYYDNKYIHDIYEKKYGKEENYNVLSHIYSSIKEKR